MGMHKEKDERDLKHESCASLECSTFPTHQSNMVGSLWCCQFLTIWVSTWMSFVNLRMIFLFSTLRYPSEYWATWHTSSPKNRPQEKVNKKRHLPEFGKGFSGSLQKEVRGPTVLHSHNFWGCVQPLLVQIVQICLPVEPESRLQIPCTQGHVCRARWTYTEWVRRLQLCVLWSNLFEVDHPVSVTHKSPQNMQQWGKAWSKRWTNLVD
jgi:hypothetical protein